MQWTCNDDCEANTENAEETLDIDGSASENEADEEIDSVVKTKHEDAVAAFKICMKWAQENQMPLKNITLLQSMQETASFIYIKSQKKKKN